MSVFNLMLRKIRCRSRVVMALMTMDAAGLHAGPLLFETTRTFSHDGGVSWTGLRRAEELITPRCHGPVERFSLGDKPRLLFSSPASPIRTDDWK